MSVNPKYCDNDVLAGQEFTSGVDPCFIPGFNGLGMVSAYPVLKDGVWCVEYYDGDHPVLVTEFYSSREIK